MSPNTSQVQQVSRQHAVSFTEKKRPREEEEEKISPYSQASTEAATPHQLSANNKLESAFSAIDDMMDIQPRIEQSPQVATATKIPSDFMTIAQAPMPYRQHWATDSKRVASIDDKFEAPTQDD